MQKLINFLNELVDPAALQVFNRYAALLAGALLFSFLLKAFFFHPADLELKRLFDEKPKQATVEKTDGKPANQKPYSFYAEPIAGKNLFTVSSRSAASSQNAGGFQLKNITLVGILPGDTPQAVLEDKVSQKTYYLSKNESLENMTVKDIRDNAVILEYNGETETLTL